MKEKNWNGLASRTGREFADVADACDQRRPHSSRVATFCGKSCAPSGRAPVSPKMRRRDLAAHRRRDRTRPVPVRAEPENPGHAAHGSATNPGTCSECGSPAHRFAAAFFAISRRRSGGSFLARALPRENRALDGFITQPLARLGICQRWKVPPVRARCRV
jgi:hypothetical protein